MCKSERKMIGLGMDGGNAEYCVVREAICVPVPKGVPAGAAASASDAILTALSRNQNYWQTAEGSR